MLMNLNLKKILLNFIIRALKECRRGFLIHMMRLENINQYESIKGHSKMKELAILISLILQVTDMMI